MHLEMAFIFNNSDITKTVLEELTTKHDVTFEYIASNGTHLIHVKKGGVVITSNKADADVIVLVDAFTGQLTALPIYSITIIRVLN